VKDALAGDRLFAEWRQIGAVTGRIRRTTITRPIHRRNHLILK
jgi:hypothetical protein